MKQQPMEGALLSVGGKPFHDDGHTYEDVFAAMSNPAYGIHNR